MIGPLDFGSTATKRGGRSRPDILELLVFERLSVAQPQPKLQNKVVISSEARDPRRLIERNAEDPSRSNGMTGQRIF
uniref:Uncharacterized protein n=1 Tax=Candidatus Kentrum sp. TUN TaxID=2126343 RepID=A0A450ZRU3_9GAMM|nr:MAG: hypothetical protein BECKTUN1418D_GA0071000_10471 [Candidatus Kentron sp. TUN]